MDREQADGVARRIGSARRRGRVGAAVATLAAALVLPAGPAHAAGATYTSVLDGSQVVPGPGDPDGSGIGRVRVEPARGVICWQVKGYDVDSPAVLHVHRGGPGQRGPIVVALSDPDPRTQVSRGCVVDPEGARAIAAAPGLHYLNYHTARFPAGAIRGQLA